MRVTKTEDGIGGPPRVGDPMRLAGDAFNLTAG